MRSPNISGGAAANIALSSRRTSTGRLLLPHDNIALPTWLLIDDEQIQRPIIKVDSLMPLSNRFDDKVYGLIDVAVASLRVGDAKPAGQDIRVTDNGMFVLTQCAARCDLVD
jgi:hypothetical protein